MQATTSSAAHATGQPWYASNTGQYSYAGTTAHPPYPTPTYSAHAALRNGHHQSYEAIMGGPNMAGYRSPAQSYPYALDRSPTSMPPQQAYGALDSQSVPLAQPSGNMHAPQNSSPYPQSHSPPASHPYATPHSPSMSHGQDSLAQYPAQLNYQEPLDSLSQYPASPQRPFSCDMCALSFNRQHDLKRHRDTHTGEKPFLCNGGCGKTFTRKDALKRHQVCTLQPFTRSKPHEEIVSQAVWHRRWRMTEVASRL